MMRMDNGVHTAYEGNSSAAGIANCWHREYYRAEFEEGTVEVGQGDTITITQAGQEPKSYEAPAIARHGHEHLLDEFLNWLDGGPPAHTRIEENLKSFAIVMAAMDTTRDNQPKIITEYLA